MRALIVSFLCMAGVATAAPPPQKVRTVEGITEYRLSNGLVVLLFPDPTQSTFTVNVTYLVGSRLEGYGETGMAHLLEHMMFKGTPSLKDIGKLLDARGAEENASTWTDRTNYFETLPATGDNLDWTLRMEADRMVHSRIADSDLQSEFSVVRSEFEQDENQPLAILQERVVSTAYLWHNYGKSTIGSKADIERVPATSLRRFYEKYYQPDNAVLIVSGKIDEPSTLSIVQRTFGALARPTRVLEPSYTVEPVQDGERSVVLRRTGDISGVAVAYHTVGAASPDFPAVQAALSVLGREGTGRLYKQLVVGKLASAVYADQLPFRDPYLAIVSAEVRDGKKLDEVERDIVSAAESLGDRPVADKEIERWRAGVQAELELELSNSQRLALSLSEFAALGDWRMVFAYRDRVAKVTAADVQRVARSFFKSSNRTTGRFLPTKAPDRAPLVETPDVAAAVKGIEHGDVKDPGEPFAATLDNLEARTQRASLPGIEVALLPKKTRGGRVSLVLRLHLGDEASLRRLRPVAEAAALLMNRGSAKLSFEDYRDALDLMRARVEVWAEPGAISVHVEALRDKVPAVVDLVLDQLQHPTFSSKELAIAKQEAIASLEQERQDPSSVAALALRRALHPWPKDDPRYVATIDEQIAEYNAVTIDQIRAFDVKFVGAGHAELAAVGDFDAAALQKQLTARLAGWSSKAPYARLAGKLFPVPGSSSSLNIPDKEEASLVFGQSVALHDADADYPAWLLAGYLLGGDTGARLWLRVREREGLSYEIAASASASPFDEPDGVFQANAIMAPQNIAKVRASVLDELTKLASGSPITDDELARAKSGWLQMRDTELSNDDAVASLLADTLYHHRTLAFSRDLRSKIGALRSSDLSRVFAKYLRPSDLLIIDVGDHAKASAAPAKP
ncbi:MAG TPA: insulinase family protein [Kofleriaceae bacterium]|jgi:zinc protease